MKNLKMYTIGIAILTSAMIFSACSDDSNSENTSEKKEFTGKFIDSAVEGLDYNCSSGNTGTTNSDGEFTCFEDDNVSFLLDDLLIGTVGVDDIITPQTLFPDDSNASLNLAQLLQTLDDNSNPDDGIVLEESLVSNLDGEDINFTDPNFDTLVSDLIGTTLVEEAEAMEHLNIILSDLNISLTDIITESLGDIDISSILEEASAS